VDSQQTVLARRRRWAVRRLVTETATAVLLAVCGVVLVGSDPLDYRFHTALIAGTLACLLPFVLVLLAARLAASRRASVVLSPHGVGTVGRGNVIPWSDLRHWRTVTGWRGRQVEITLGSGRCAVLNAPLGNPWRPDPSFDRDVAAFGAWAGRYGVAIAPPSRAPRGRAVVVALAAAALVTVAFLRLADRGVIWPWTSTATQARPACAALNSAGLDQHWPLQSRTLDRDEVDRHKLGEWSYCWWASSTGHDDAPYRRLTAAVKLHTAFTPFSPVAMAARDYGSAHEQAVGYRPLRGIDDEAFAATSGDQVQVTGRRANVTVSVELWLNRAGEAAAESVARQLVENILAAVPLR